MIEAYHHASEGAVGGHDEVPHGFASAELGVDQGDQQRCAAAKASSHCGAHCTSGHNLQPASGLALCKPGRASL